MRRLPGAGVVMRAIRLGVLKVLLGFAAVAVAGEGLEPLLEQPLAPDFTLKDPRGGSHRLSGYRGKPVIVNFWATWCPPCRAEMPSMQRAWEAVKGEEILILAVNVGEGVGAIDEFAANQPVGFPLLMDPNAALMRTWPLKGLPTTFVVDPQGRLVYRAVGEREWDDPKILDQVRALRTGADVEASKK